MTPLVVAVISYATVGMFRSLSTGRTRRLTTILAFLIVLALPLWDLGSFAVFAQLAPIVFGALMGLAFLRGSVTPADASTGEGASEGAGGRGLVLVGLIGFFALLAAALAIILLDLGSTQVQLLAGFYEAGSLVFGGGHVVLPLLNDVLVEPDLVAESAFRTGYGFAQAIPGPVFAVAAFLGGQFGGVTGVVLGVLGTLAIFLPGVLLVMAVMPLSASFSRNRAYKAALAGVNAAVVGLLGATALTLFTQLFTPGTLVQQSTDTTAHIAAALLGLFFLWVLRLPPLVLIGLTLVAALLTTLL
jgi:chromate transporter